MFRFMIDDPADTGCVGFALRIWRLTLSVTWRLPRADWW